MQEIQRIFIFANATGTQKILLAMIGNVQNPWWFGICLHKVKFKYFSQKKAWSDTKSFKTWFYKVLLPRVCSKTKNKMK